MIIPVGYDLYTNNADWIAFAISMGLCGFGGILLILANKQNKIEISGRQAFMLTALSWVFLCFFSALPLVIALPHIGFTNAMFEAVSGLTTTGSTVLTDLETLPYGILIWRALLQWLGGIGIIVMAISILPFLRVGGMQLFRLESSEKDKALPKVTDMTKALTIAYLILTAGCYMAYSTNGMPHFESLVHAMTTISTGGFSTSDASFTMASNPIKLSAIVFMLLASLPFMVFIKIWLGTPRAFAGDEQAVGFLKLQSLFVITLITYLIFKFGGIDWDLAIDAMFNIVSISTGTGYASYNYMVWGPFVVGLMLFVSCIGGCAGSTSCGIKVFRFQILYLVAKNQILQLIYPNGVFNTTYNKQPLSVSVAASVMAFFFIFVTSLVVITLALLACGLDMITALSGAVSTLSNVGPGLGEVIGPTGSYAPLPDTAKWVMILSMLLGRLEFFTLLVFFVPRFWRH